MVSRVARARLCVGGDPCNFHLYASNGARMHVYAEVRVGATVLDNGGRRVAVSLSFVEADVKRPILSSAKMGEAGLMTCTGPTWSGLAAVQDVVLRADAA